MPNPRKPIIELTPRVQAVAALIILAGSAILGSMAATAEAPRQQTRFGRNFATPIVIVPVAPAAPVIQLDQPRPAAPRPAPARPSTSSEI